MAQSRCLLATMLLAIAPSAHAQVVLDGSVGPAGPLNGPNFAIPENLGARNGPNLLHSFCRFNLQPGQSATFSGGMGIQRVIARVTGGEASSIRGTIRSTIPNADFYLINPAGVVFGPGASLDVPGAFVVSTAHNLHLADGGIITTANLDQTVLSTAAPSAFGFLSTPAAISFDQATLEVDANRALQVVGGDISLAQSHLRSPQGRVSLTALAAAGQVDAGNVQSSTAEAHGKIRVDDQSSLQVDDDTAGRIQIRGGQLVVRNSDLNAQTQNGDGGTIDIQLDGDLIVTGNSRISTATGGSGAAGDILIDTRTLALLDGGVIIASTIGAGAGGSIRVNASDSVVIDSNGVIQGSGITSSTSAIGGGAAGDIRIDTVNLDIRNRGLILASTFGTGAGGAIDITAEHLRIDGLTAQDFTGIGAQSTLLVGGGDGGAIRLSVGELVIRHGSIGASTFGSGHGGLIRIEADRIDMDGGDAAFTAIVAQAGRDTPLSTGDGGGITIRARSLDSAAPKLVMQRGAFISARAFAQGDGGDIDLTLRSLRLASRSAIESENLGIGNAGSITIDARHVKLRSGALLATSAAMADAGNIVIQNAHTIDIDHATLSAQAFVDGGSITLLASQMIDIDGSVITAQAGDDGGNITIDPVFVILSDSFIDARAKGSPVVVSLTAQYFLSQNSVILTQAGPQTLESTLDLSGSIVPLSIAPLGSDVQLHDVCSVAGMSSLLLGGRGSTPPSPAGWLISP